MKFRIGLVLVGVLLLCGQGCETAQVPVAEVPTKSNIAEEATKPVVPRIVEPAAPKPAPTPTTPKAAPKQQAPIAPSVPKPAPVLVPKPAPTPVKSCCKVCSKGKACGDTCISRSYTCHKGPGCACDG
jgi:hypothetical protein